MVCVLGVLNVTLVHGGLVALSFSFHVLVCWGSFPVLLGLWENHSSPGQGLWDHSSSPCLSWEQ